MSLFNNLRKYSREAEKDTGETLLPPRGHMEVRTEEYTELLDMIVAGCRETDNIEEIKIAMKMAADIQFEFIKDSIEATMKVHVQSFNDVFGAKTTPLCNHYLRASCEPSLHDTLLPECSSCTIHNDGYVCCREFESLSDSVEGYSSCADILKNAISYTEKVHALPEPESSNLLPAATRVIR